MEANFYILLWLEKKKNCKNCAKRETSDVTVVLTRLFSPSSLFGFLLIILPTPLSEHMCISQLSLSEPGKTFFVTWKKIFFFFFFCVATTYWFPLGNVGVCVHVFGFVCVICKGVWLNTYEAAMMKGIIRVHLFSVWFLHSLTQRGVYCFSGGNQLKEET